MRILLANDHATPMGGAEIAMARLRDGLRGRGHEVELLSTTATSLDVEPDADHLAPGTLHPRLRVVRETLNPSAARAMARTLDSFRPDVVHLRLFLTQLSPLVLRQLRSVPTVHQVVFYKPICPRGTKVLPDGAPCVFPAGPACRQQGCTSIASQPFAQLQRRLYERWSDAIDATTALSASSARLLRLWGLEASEVIPNGVQEREPRPALSDPPAVGFAGRMVLEKGPDVLLEAFQQIATLHPTARLLLIGDGPLREPLRRAAEAAGILDRVEIPGHLARPEVEKRLEQVWVQVVPGRWVEPFGTVTLEAAARGTAVIATDVGGPAEVVREAGLGWTVPPEDPEALAHAILRVLEDRDLAERTGAAARRGALEQYGFDRVLEGYEALYRRLCAGGDALAGPADR